MVAAEKQETDSGFDLAKVLEDPILFAEVMWPHVEFYKEQEDIIESVRDNRITVVPAGNQLGKDFVSAFIVLWFFLSRNPCRIITTSAKDDHLRVLWGEIERFISTARFPLDYKRGGPLIVNHQDIRKVIDGDKDGISYILGMVASTDSMAAMGGHHATPSDIEAANDGIPRTLFMADECSSVPDAYYPVIKPWAKRELLVGNCWECNNFFKHAVKGKPGSKDRGGDIKASDGSYWRKVIRIKAENSPNVRFGLAEKAAGKKPSNKVIIPGVLSYSDYEMYREHWDEIQQCVSLDADFYQGKGVLLFPPDWLARAERRAQELERALRKAKSIGCDPGEGGDDTSWAVVDELGLIELISAKTPDTSVVTGMTLDIMRRHGVSPEKVCFDRGGGGKEHADRLRAQGYPVHTVAFGEAVQLELKRGLHLMKDRREVREERYTFKNRRAEMYGNLSVMLDPMGDAYESKVRTFAIPTWGGPQYTELRRQLAPIPKRYDGEGRLYLPPKNKKDPNSKEETLKDILGCSPDEADALVIAIHAMTMKPVKGYAGVS